MKVDKAVSTSNDNAIIDLHNNGTLRYESILSTLVEKKILAIKRDCEQSEQKLKQQRKHNCLGGLLFGKRRRQRELENEEQQQQQQCEPKTTIDNNITKSMCPRLAADTIVVNECVAVGDALAHDDAKSAVVLVNRNKLIENDNNHHHQGGGATNEAPHTKPLNEENCGSNSTIASHTAVQIDYVGKSMPQLPGDGLRPARKISSDTQHSAPTGGASTIDQEHRRRLRVLEAKSISAQCSPIFPRQTFAGDAAATLPPLAKLKSSIPQRLMSRQNTSDDSVNVTFSSVLVNEDALDSGDTASDNVTMGRKMQSRKKDGNKLGRCSVANDAHGFISSFNQLTSSNNLPAVISTTKLRSGAAGEAVRVSRFPVVEAARTTNTPQPSDSGAMQKSMVSGRSSDEEETLKNDKRKNRKCGRAARLDD